MNRTEQLFRLFLSAAILLISVGVGAQPRNEAEALTIAQSFLGEKSHTSKALRLAVVKEPSVDGMMTRRAGSAGKADEKQCFYVVNDEANDRFVIISGDERQEDVLGYSEDGQFNPEAIPCGLCTFLYQYSREYELLQQKTVVTSHPEGEDKVQEDELGGTVPRRAAAIGPLLKTTWGQSPYYNYYCPMDPSTKKQCITGCQATAMAQIMKYYNYPSVGQGSNAYISKKNSIELSENFASMPFNWSKMLNSYDKNSSSQAVDAVARLMYACGVAINMDYGSGESSASMDDASYAFIYYFKYNPNTRQYQRAYHTGEEWEQLIMEELNAGRPILYRGVGDPDSNGNAGGHAFVLDGCDGSGRYHFNWGWKGSADGYFALSSLKPKTSSTQYNYTNKQGMVCQIDPNQVGKHEDPWYAEKFEFDGNTRKMTFTKLYCHSSDANKSSAGFTGYRGWELKNIGTGKSVYGLYEATNVKANYGWNTLSYTINANQFAEGTSYYLYPVIYDKSKQWKTYIRTAGGNTDYYLLKVKNGKIEVTVKGNPDNTATTPVMQFVGLESDNQNLENLTKKDVLALHGTFYNKGKTAVVGTRVRIWDENMNGVAASNTINVTFPSNSETTVDMDYPLTDLPAGKYIASIQYQKAWDDNKWYYSENCLLHFTVKSEATTPNLQGVSVSCDNNNLDSLTKKDKLIVQAKIKNTGKTENIQMRYKIWNEELETVAVSEVFTKKFTEDAITTVVFEFPLDNIPDGNYIGSVQFLNSWSDNKWYYFQNLLVNFSVVPSTPIIQFISVDCDNQNLNRLTKKDKLVCRANFKNSGITKDVYFRFKIWTKDMETVAVSDYVKKEFLQDSQTSVVFEFPLKDVPSGNYYASIQYYNSWERDAWIYSSKFLKDITILAESVGIRDVQEEVKEELIYDLSGQRLTKPRKGINIIGGKKVLFGDKR